MVAAKHVSPYPHPAFPEVLLPHSVQQKLKRGNKPHYPQEYLDALKPYDSVPEEPVERLAKFVVSVILAVSLVSARANILWAGNSRLLNYSAGQKNRIQTVWLRRLLLLEALAPCHGLASGLLHHSETVLFGYNSAAMHSMVYALFPEFLSHRTHFATAQAIAKPGFITRLLLVSTQILGYFVQAFICVIYMPLCFQLARFTSEAASRVYADLGKDIDAGEVPDIAHAKVPPATHLFYNMPEGANMRLVCQCIEADDVFHAEWEHTASRHHHDTTAHMYGIAKQH